LWRNQLSRFNEEQNRSQIASQSRGQEARAQY
jgi:hypothetical protein